MKSRILPYFRWSNSAKELSNSLGGLRIKHSGNFRHTRNHLVINWGCCDKELVASKVKPLLPSLNCSVNFDGELNVSIAGDKLESFKVWGRSIQDNIPEFTDSREEAQAWVNDGQTTVCRLLLRASGGRGIVTCSEGELPEAPLYVKYIKKQDEYRVHIFNGEVIDVQRKMRKREVPDEQVDWRVRNHSNGFIFGRDGVDLPDVATDLAIQATSLLHLDFGAVDLIYNKHYDKYYVLEINTAPGLEGTTLIKYTEAVRRFL